MCNETRQETNPLFHANENVQITIKPFLYINLEKHNKHVFLIFTYHKMHILMLHVPVTVIHYVLCERFDATYKGKRCIMSSDWEGFQTWRKDKRGTRKKKDDYIDHNALWSSVEHLSS